jgi:hypothetical protein
MIPSAAHLAWEDIVLAIKSDDPTHLRHWIDLTPANLESEQHFSG